MMTRRDRKGGGEGGRGKFALLLRQKPIQHYKLFQNIYLNLKKKNRINGKRIRKKKERDLGRILYTLLYYLPESKKEREKIVIIFLTNTYGTSTAVPCNGKTY